MPASSSGSEGRGETTGPAGARADSTADAPSVETSSNQTPPRTQSFSGPLFPADVPVIYVMDYKKGKRKKKIKYSSGLKDVQRFERGLSKASHRLSRSLDRGFSIYRKRRDKSARKKKDGAIRDALENLSKGLGKTVRVSSNAPYDVARQVNTKSFSRQLRNTLRLFTPPLFR